MEEKNSVEHGNRSDIIINFEIPPIIGMDIDEIEETVATENLKESPTGSIADSESSVTPVESNNSELDIVITDTKATKDQEVLVESSNKLDYMTFGDHNYMQLPLNFVKEDPETTTDQEMSEESDIKNANKDVHHMSCSICFLVEFNSLAEFVNHCLLRHLDEELIECGRCRITFDTREKFLNHLLPGAKIITDNTRMKCQFCPRRIRKYYFTRAAIGDHMEKEHGNPTRCTFSECKNKKFSNTKSLTNHIARCHLYTEAQCSLCCQKMHVFSASKQEINRNEVAPLKDLINNLKFRTNRCPLCTQSLEDHRRFVYRCTTCTAKFDTQARLVKHACRKIKSLTCEECEVTHASRMRMTFHLQTHLKCRRCNACDRVFDNETECFEHIEGFHGGPGIACFVCRKQFSGYRERLAHLKTHYKNVDTYECPDCWQVFQSFRQFGDHVLEHKNKITYKCDKCEKVIRHQSNFFRHLRKHAAKLNNNTQILHQCNVCKMVSFRRDIVEKHFSENHGLDNQTQISSVEADKVFKCEYCDICFVDKKNRTDHLLCHTVDPEFNRILFSCEICGSKFATSTARSNHMHAHSLLQGIERIPQKTTNKVDETRYIIPQYYNCCRCNMQFLELPRYNHHMRTTNHGLQEEERKHQKIIFSDSSSDEETRKPHYFRKCKFCPMGFSHIRRFRKHQNEQHPEKFICQYCNKKFMKVGWLDKHIWCEHTTFEIL